jgi:hypothetical protein
MSELDNRVRDLEIAQAKQEVLLEQVAKVLQDNTTAIAELTAALNRGKGAMWGLTAFSTLVGAGVASAISYFKG